MYFGADHDCELGFQFAKDHGKCISEEMVDRDCYVVVMDAGKEPGKSEDIGPDDQTIISHPDEASEVEGEKQQIAFSPLETYDPDLCPKGFVGFNHKEDCTKYYECNEGYLGPVHACEDGLKFDRSLGLCFPEKYVNEDCMGVALDAKKEHDQIQEYRGGDDEIVLQLNAVSEDEEHAENSYSDNGVYSPDLYQQGFIGFQIGGGDDCTMYYECNAGYLVAVHTCGSGLLFDKISSKCISKTLVDLGCIGQASDLDTAEYNEPVKAVSKNSVLSKSNSIYDAIKDQQQVEDEEENKTTQTMVEDDTTPDNYDLKLCLPGFIGFRSNKGCSKYYQCNNGFAGAMHICKAGFMLDRHRGHCISAELVDSFCFGPPIDAKIEPYQHHSPIVEVNIISSGPTLSPVTVSLSPTKTSRLSEGRYGDPAGQLESNNRKPTPRPTLLIRTVTPSTEGGGDFVQTSTASPTISTEDFGHWLWLSERDDLNGERYPRQMKLQQFWMALILYHFCMG